MDTYSNEYLDYWGDVFCELNLADKGLPFSRFIKDPDAIVELLKNNPLNAQFKPLLPAQQRVQDQLDRELIEQHMTGQFERHGHTMEMHGERNLEPMNRRAANKLWKTGLGFNH